MSSASDEKQIGVPQDKQPPTTLTDWDGPDDPDNPRNWTFGKKLYATAVPALYAFVVSVT